MTPVFDQCQHGPNNEESANERANDQNHRTEHTDVRNHTCVSGADLNSLCPVTRLPTRDEDRNPRKHQDQRRDAIREYILTILGVLNNTPTPPMIMSVMPARHHAAFAQIITGEMSKPSTILEVTEFDLQVTMMFTSKCTSKRHPNTTGIDNPKKLSAGFSANMCRLVLGKTRSKRCF
eukprot:CAMPEP_0194481094 /NCGR_PEP_ID=MMETSP0253-20130528/3680_1 /TAXON_ID=2966 /ORGANISM="Noctiluca scintillans" /LENGTH=177 /DNA_ID=CAMNT_0039320561 /DNA_START=440 /DNA_END=971 /DNA_ORIENTATION=-